MSGFDDAIQCRECGKIYWNRWKYCDHPPRYCKRCGAQLFVLKDKKVKKCFLFTGHEYWDIEKTLSINDEKAKEIVAKKILFWWKVRKDGAANA